MEYIKSSSAMEDVLSLCNINNNLSELEYRHDIIVEPPIEIPQPQIIESQKEIISPDVPIISQKEIISPGHMPIVFADREFVNTRTGKRRIGITFDNYLKHNFDKYLIRGVANGWDGIIGVSGAEGTGKSTFTQFLAAYCDRNHRLTLDRIVFSGQELMQAIDNAKPGDALVYDEAITGMASQDSGDSAQKVLIKKFTLIRKKRLFIFLVIPSFFMLRKYFAIFRTRALIHAYTPDGVSRGYYKFYSFNTKKILYLRGYKEMDMGCMQPDFKGCFVDTYGFFVDSDAYEAKKDEAIRQLTVEKTTKEQKLVQAYEDNKLKLKLEVEKFKGVWKDKYSQQKAEFAQKFKEYKEAQEAEMRLVKEDGSVLQTSKDKTKIAELTEKYNRLMYFAYETFKQYSDNPNKFTPELFRLVLLKSKVGTDSLNNITKVIESGKNLYQIDRMSPTINA
jgi:hypothetical protein